MQAKLDTVKKHMTGKRFNAAKGKLCAKQYKSNVRSTAANFGLCPVAEFENDERELMEEPDIETSEEVSPCACLWPMAALQLSGLQATSESIPTESSACSTPPAAFVH